MKLAEIVAFFESIAPAALQESYDNSGLIVGNPDAEIHKALLCLDSTEAIVDEAIANNCNLIIAHHPIVFSGLKKLNGKTYVERVVIKAIQNNIAIYACHTNLDYVLQNGVNAKIAQKLSLENCSILAPKAGNLQKLVVFVPYSNAETVRNAMFEAGAGNIGNYDECSFNMSGQGTFRAGDNTSPHVGTQGSRHIEDEIRIETILPDYLAPRIINAMKTAHPYEEVAYDLIPLGNSWEQVGSGLVGSLKTPISPEAFLESLKQKMGAKVVRFTRSKHTLIEKVAVCGGAGSFLIRNARQAGAQAYVTADVKYHEFFDAENDLMLCDIGHFESEKYTIELFGSLLSEKFPNFATIFASTDTNPVQYYY